MNGAVSQTFDASVGLGRAAYLSWASMKAPVMAWLWFLNVLYWVSFVYWPRPEAVAAAVSYLAVGLLIVWMVVRQRGLTRLSGLIHLPWVPFVVYLGFRLYSDTGSSLSIEADGLYYIWLVTIFWSTVVCLLLDAADVVRWIAGERYVLGTPAAAAAGASKLAPVDWRDG